MDFYDLKHAGVDEKLISDFNSLLGNVKNFNSIENEQKMMDNGFFEGYSLQWRAKNAQELVRGFQEVMAPNLDITTNSPRNYGELAGFLYACVTNQKNLGTVLEVDALFAKALKELQKDENFNEGVLRVHLIANIKNAARNNEDTIEAELKLIPQTCRALGI